MRGVPAALDGRKGLRLQGFAALKRYGKFLLMREKEKNMRQVHTVALIVWGLWERISHPGFMRSSEIISG